MPSQSGRARALYLLAHTPYPPVAGGSRRAVSIIAALETFMDVTVAAADEPGAAIRGWSEAAKRFTRRRCSRRDVTIDAIEGLIRGQHGLLIRSVKAGMPNVVEAWLRDERPDIVILGRPLLAPYMRAAHRQGVRVIVDADESLEKVAWSVARSRTATARNRVRFAIEASAVGRMERNAYPHADQLWVSSEPEQRWLGTIVDQDRIFVIPNAVDAPPDPPTAPEVRAICFLGWYRYPPNEAAALELMTSIMPAIRAAGGPSHLVLIGSEPTAAMARTAARLGDVTITGRVADVVPEMRAAGVLVVPLRAGGGTRIKILEAAAAGVPVISTQLGIEGLAMVADRHVRIAETADEFASAVRGLSSDDAGRTALVQAAYQLVRDRYSSNTVREGLSGALSRLGLGNR